MTSHAGSFVSIIEESVSQELVNKVEKIQTPMLVVREQLVRHGLISENHISCKGCVSNPEACIKLKGYVQQLMDRGTV